jgi:hypothetical protein
MAGNNLFLRRELMFTISVKVRKRLVEVKLSGLMSVSEIAELRAAMRETLRVHGLLPCSFVLLLDATENPIQPQAVHEALNSLGTDPAILPSRSAVWIGDSPSRMQARRSAPACPNRLFKRREDAVEWLLAGEASADAGEFPVAIASKAYAQSSQPFDWAA